MQVKIEKLVELWLVMIQVERNVQVESPWKASAFTQLSFSFASIKPGFIVVNKIKGKGKIQPIICHEDPEGK